ncbi:hypothetical protein EON64_15140 [archaeon]|nr:MAG: hypothetical protein EON64_15140 [archaeon]
MQQQVPASANWKKDKVHGNELLLRNDKLTPILPVGGQGGTPARMGPNGPEMSDISDDEEEDEMALLQGQGGNVDSALKDNSKRNRIFWTTEKEDYLIRVYNHYRKTYSGGHGLKGKSWRYIAVHMTRRYSEVQLHSYSICYTAFP